MTLLSFYLATCCLLTLAIPGRHVKRITSLFSLLCLKLNDFLKGYPNDS
jgi:hypothetical protein